MTHDLTGRNYAFTPVSSGLKGSVCIWDSVYAKAKAGDYVILRNGSGTTRYMVESVWWPPQPGDQVFLRVIFAPREQ